MEAVGGLKAAEYYGGGSGGPFGDVPALQTPVPGLVVVPEASAQQKSSTDSYLYLAWVKPVLDAVLALVLLVVLLPLMLAVALAVRMKLGPGVIYRQQRIGQRGQAFSMFKFRTMMPDRRSSPAPYDGVDRRVWHKREDDPRHTPFGRFLRRSSLDELPQLYNVLLGHMSLVGPRPELVHIVERYEPWQHQRHDMKPGITGFWQISGRAGGRACDGVDLDIDYLSRASFRTDIMVLLSTLPAVIRRTGR